MEAGAANTMVLAKEVAPCPRMDVLNTCITLSKYISGRSLREDLGSSSLRTELGTERRVLFVGVVAQLSRVNKLLISPTGVDT